MSKMIINIPIEVPEGDYCAGSELETCQYFDNYGGFSHCECIIMQDMSDKLHLSSDVKKDRDSFLVEKSEICKHFCKNKERV